MAPVSEDSIVAKITETVKQLLDEKLRLFEVKCEKVTTSVRYDLDKMRREKNVIVFGIKEGDKETMQQQLKEVMKVFEKIGVKDALIDDVRRLGKYVAKGKTHCPLLVKFVRTVDKRAVLTNKTKLGKEKIFINNDMSPEERRQEKALKEKFKNMKAKDKDLKMSIRNGNKRIFKDGILLEIISTEEEDLDNTEEEFSSPSGNAGDSRL